MSPSGIGSLPESECRKRRLLTYRASLAGGEAGRRLKDWSCPVFVDTYPLS
jgi:hypothetical protein